MSDKHAKRRRKTKDRCIYCGRVTPVTRNRVCIAHADLPALEDTAIADVLFRRVQSVLRR